MLERVVQALKTRLFRAKYPKLASPLRNYSQFLYFFPSTSNFSSSSSAYRAICPNFVTARSQLTEQMNRNAAKGSELIREFDKTRSLSRQFHSWKSWGGGRFREEERREREKKNKEERKKLDWKVFARVAWGSSEAEAWDSFPHEVVAAGCNLECGPPTFSRERRFSIKVSRIWPRVTEGYAVNSWQGLVALKDLQGIANERGIGRSNLDQ